MPLAESDPQLKKLKTPADKVQFPLQKIHERIEHLLPVSVKASLDGKGVSGDYLMFEALDIPYVGPNLFLAPPIRKRRTRSTASRVGELEGIEGMGPETLARAWPRQSPM